MSTRWLEFTLAAFHTNSPTRLKDYSSVALDIDKHAVGIYKEDGLVGHVPIELSRIISYFLEDSETNEVKVAVNGKRTRELAWLTTVNIVPEQRVNER